MKFDLCPSYLHLRIAKELSVVNAVHFYSYSAALTSSYLWRGQMGFAGYCFIIEYHEMEGIHMDHQVQLLALYRTTQKKT